MARRLSGAPRRRAADAARSRDRHAQRARRSLRPARRRRGRGRRDRHRGGAPRRLQPAALVPPLRRGAERVSARVRPPSGAWSFNAYAARFLEASPPRGFDLDAAPDGFAEFFAAALEEEGHADRANTTLAEAARIDAAFRAVFHRAPTVTPFHPTNDDAPRLFWRAARRVARGRRRHGATPRAARPSTRAPRRRQRSRRGRRGGSRGAAAAAARPARRRPRAHRSRHGGGRARAARGGAALAPLAARRRRRAPATGSSGARARRSSAPRCRRRRGAGSRRAFSEGSGSDSTTSANDAAVARALVRRPARVLGQRLRVGVVREAAARVRAAAVRLDLEDAAARAAHRLELLLRDGLRRARRHRGVGRDAARACSRRSARRRTWRRRYHGGARSPRASRPAPSAADAGSSSRRTGSSRGTCARSRAPSPSRTRSRGTPFEAAAVELDLEDAVARASHVLELLLREDLHRARRHGGVGRRRLAVARHVKEGSVAVQGRAAAALRRRRARRRRRRRPRSRRLRRRSTPVSRPPVAPQCRRFSPRWRSLGARHSVRARGRVPRRRRAVRRRARAAQVRTRARARAACPAGRGRSGVARRARHRRQGEEAAERRAQQRLARTQARVVRHGLEATTETRSEP